MQQDNGEQDLISKNEQNIISDKTLILQIPEPSYSSGDQEMTSSMWPLSAYQMARDIFHHPSTGNITFSFNSKSDVNPEQCPTLDITTDDIHCNGGIFGVKLRISATPPNIYTDIKASQCFNISSKVVQDSFDPEYKEKFGTASSQDDSPPISEETTIKNTADNNLPDTQAIVASPSPK